MENKLIIDIEEILKKEITNVICIERNSIDLDLASQAFFNYLKNKEIMEKREKNHDYL
jgi:uncharacterized protein YjhX (UPF0386 family)